MSSVVTIEVDGVDVTDRVLLRNASFESLSNAQPGTCEFTVLDPDQDFAPVTGTEIVLSVDGVPLWGGFLMQVSKGFPFPADVIPIDAEDYTKRQWVLRGTDYNILFDKRVVRNTAAYTEGLPLISGTTMDGAALKFFMNNYVDVPAGFDVETFVDDIVPVSANLDAEKQWAYVQQGTKIREQFSTLALRSEAIFYFDASKNLHWHALEVVESRWGFSDQPNYNGITTSPAEFQGALWGFREVTAIEDASAMVNDALIWGGSEWAGSGSTVFARVQHTTSINTHSRWQVGEVHIGEFGYGIQDGVDARAQVIVNGPPGIGVGVGGALEQKGLRNPQHTFSFSWFDNDVPELDGDKNHLIPGALVTVVLNTFGVTKLFPLRQLRVTFPAGAPDGTTHIRFDGTIGIQLDDPFSLWKYLSRNTKRVTRIAATSADASSGTVTFGAFYSDELSPAPDGVETTFSMAFGYIAGTTAVFINGLMQRRGTDYTESDPEAGEVTFDEAPHADDELWIEARTLAS